MKIELKNFGPIDHFEFDMDKDLHVIYGENNLGKSYAMSAVYLILKHIHLAFQETDYFVNNRSAFHSNFNKSLNNTFPNTLKNAFSKKPEEIILRAANNNTYQITPHPFKDITDGFGDINEMNQMLLDAQSKNKYFKNFYNEINVNALYFLPASRSGLYIGIEALTPILAQLSQYRRSISENITLPSYSEPIYDYFLKISEMNLQEDNTDISSFIEQKILKGNVFFDPLQKKIKFKQYETNLVFDLSQTSSMVAEIAPIVAFIKYVLNKKSILFIEEPEAHLHPKIQVEMMKVFVELVKAGVKVVMTTHSDYMKDTLSNLLLAGEIAPEKVASYRFVMGEHGSYDAGDMKATAEGIEDHNFTSVAVDLYEERVKLLEKRYEANDAQ